MDQDGTWHGGGPRSRPHCARWGPDPPKGAQLPILARVCCGQMAGWIKMLFGTEEGPSPGHIVLHGDPAPPKRGTAPPQFSAHVCCGQMAGWIKMPLGIEVGQS